MTYLTSDCPYCGVCVIADTNSNNADIIKIKTKRRTVVLAHRKCVEKEIKEHEHKKCKEKDRD